MNDERDHELRELIALAAVGALDAGEQAALDAAIAARPDLQDELIELQTVAATLAEAAAETPAASLRAKILAAIVDEPQLPDLGEGLGALDGAIGADATGPVPPGPNGPAPHDAVVVPLDARRRRWAPLAAAAAVLALVGGGLVARTLTAGDDTLDLAAVVEDDTAVTYQLDGTISSIRLVHSSEHRAAALVGEDVPMPEGDQVYELWLIIGGEPQRMDIFRPHDDGSVEMLVVDMEMPADADFAITVEPAGGTDAPTGDVVATTA